jgi:hypothetical protein
MRHVPYRVAHRYLSYVHTLSVDSNRAQAITETRLTTLMEGVAYRGTFPRHCRSIKALLALY